MDISEHVRRSGPAIADADNDPVGPFPCKQFQKRIEVRARRLQKWLD